VTRQQLKAEVRGLRESARKLDSWTEHKHPADFAHALNELARLLAQAERLSRWYRSKLN